MDIENTSPERDTPEVAQQLSLLPTPTVPLRFRLDAETRERGLRHVAELRELLARRRADRSEVTRSAPPARPPRRAA